MDEIGHVKKKVPIEKMAATDATIVQIEFPLFLNDEIGMTDNKQKSTMRVPSALPWHKGDVRLF